MVGALVSRFSVVSLSPMQPAAALARDVAGMPDQRLGEVPHAWIVPSGTEVDAAALTAWCREHLAPYEVPAAFRVTSEIPRSDVGKLLRRELREQGLATPGRQATL
ncbi:hypothetical protein [Spongiactinospora sp. TRM90649]|uniref:AMP-binding enzyme n=1 Tax=Spongiactinospora sp. TRM90649 TaxID=3031114 RepID=UPI0023F6BE9F|nr:hypothetical protein [Spongiactinospora sp. TRM90649]MDF5752236.1 hypothetical protein [Spongiactinospora sp. TRM90649]